MTKILKNLLLFISIVAGVMYFSSCEQYTYLVETTLPPIDTSSTDSTKYVSFSKSIQPIFNAKCATCHKPPKNPDLREGYSHAALATGGYVNLPAATSLLYTQITKVSSHKSMCTKPEMDSIYVWISQGSKDN